MPGARVQCIGGVLDRGDELEDGLGLIGKGAIDLSGGERFVGGGPLVIGEWAWVDRGHAGGGGLAEEGERHVELGRNLAHLRRLGNAVFEGFEHVRVGGQVAECPGGDGNHEASSSSRMPSRGPDT